MKPRLVIVEQRDRGRSEKEAERGQTKGGRDTGNDYDERECTSDLADAGIKRGSRWRVKSSGESRGPLERGVTPATGLSQAEDEGVLDQGISRGRKEQTRATCCSRMLRG